MSPGRQPSLTPLAASGLTVVMILAALFQISRGELAQLGGRAAALIKAGG